jgi:hypothetical protein
MLPLRHIVAPKFDELLRGVMNWTGSIQSYVRRGTRNNSVRIFRIRDKHGPMIADDLAHVERELRSAQACAIDARAAGTHMIFTGACAGD